MRVPRKVNTKLQAFNAWSHKINIDSQVKVTDIQNAYTAQWKDPNKDFLPHKVTLSSPDWSSGSSGSADWISEGLL